MSKEEKHPLAIIAEEGEEEAERQREAIAKGVKEGRGEFGLNGRYFLDGIDVTNYLPRSPKERAEIREKSEKRSANADGDEEVRPVNQVELNTSPAVRPGGAETEPAGPAPQRNTGDSQRDSDSRPKSAAKKSK